MSENELLQWAAIAGGGVVVGAGVFALVRFSRKLDALWPDTAKKYGLAYTKNGEGSAFTNSKEAHTLTGPSLTVISTREQVGNQRRTGTLIAAVSERVPAGLQLEISRTRPKASLHLVTTGDARFDGLRFVLSESAEQARALMTPEVRAWLLKCPQWTLRVATERGRVVLSFGDLVTDHADLEGPIEVALALARVT